MMRLSSQNWAAAERVFNSIEDVRKRWDATVEQMFAVVYRGA
jgi:hypothetical protein